MKKSSCFFLEKLCKGSAKSNAECQACLNIMLRCSLPYAKVIKEDDSFQI